MNSLSNPYISDSLSGRKNIFAGRSEILKSTEHFLNNPNEKGMVLYGHRGIGKTSLMCRIEKMLSGKSIFIPVYFDLQGKSDISLDQLLAQVIRSILKIPVISSLYQKNDKNMSGRPSRILVRLLSKIPDNISLVLLFDEFDPPDASNPDKTRIIFYHYICKLISLNIPQVKFIFALGRQSDDFDKIYNRLLTNLKLEYISLFSHEEISELVRISEKDLSLKWPEAQLSAIWNITAGHPYLTRNLCQVIWEKVHRKPCKEIPTVYFKDMGLGFGQAIKNAEDVFKWLWEGLGPWERILVSALAEGGSKNIKADELADRVKHYGFFNRNGSLHHMLSSLEKWGIIKAEDDGYRIRVSMLSRWIIARKPFERIQDELNRTAEAIIHSACEMARENHLKPAVKMLRQAADLNPEHPRVNYLLAKILLKQGKPDETVKLLEPLYESNYPSIRALFIQALILLADKTENEDEQAGIYEKILNIQPGHPKARVRYWKIYENRGDKAYENKDFHEALAAYQKAGADLKAKKLEEILQHIEIKEKKPRKKRKSFLKRIRNWICTLLFLCLVCGSFAIYGAYRYLSEDLPKIYSLKDYQPPLITTVYSDDNKKIAEFYKERRIVVPLSKMSPTLIKAFIAAEDSRYFSHEGLDFLGILRAFFKNIEAGTVVQGGSTITQQVIKSFLLSSEKSYERKMKEAILAYRIDKAFSKDGILFLYLNQIYLGYGAYGVEAAAENYFGKSSSELNLAECSMLAGLAKAPSKDSPAGDLKRAKIRQKYVLNRMAAEGYITLKQAEAAYKSPLNIKPRQNWYIKEVPFYTEHIRQYIEKEYGRSALYTGGLKIYTPINLKMQEEARKQVEKGLQALEKRHRYPADAKLQGALVCLETGTGYVKAMIGGRDFKLNQFNRATQSRRQPGSSFKPVVYAAALDKGFTPLSTVYDTPVSYPGNGKWWHPRNYDNRFYGPISLRKALAKSRNVPAVKVLRRIGIDYAMDYARKLGIKSKMDRGLSLALGASGVSLVELVNAYSVFANQGKLIEPVFITKIVDRFGKDIQKKQVSKQVIEPSTAFIMTNLLKGVVNNGTGYKVKALKRPTAGKTGTTNDFRDAWFIGYTPEYITGTWVGFDIERPMGKGETGSRAASPIWLGFMQEVLKDKPVRDFEPPKDGIVYASIDASTGLLSIPESSRVVKEYFKKGTEPKRYAPRPVVKPPEVISDTEDFFKTGL